MKRFLNWFWCYLHCDYLSLLFIWILGTIFLGIPFQSFNFVILIFMFLYFFNQFTSGGLNFHYALLKYFFKQNEIFKCLERSSWKRKRKIIFLVFWNIERIHMHKTKCIYICTLSVIRKYCYTTAKLQFNMWKPLKYFYAIGETPRSKYLDICGLYSSNF